jgi:hypothetical protein
MVSSGALRNAIRCGISSAKVPASDKRECVVKLPKKQAISHNFHAHGLNSDELRRQLAQAHLPDPG